MVATVKLAVVGCGGISGAHVKGYRDLFERGCREFKVTACCDVNVESATLRAQEIAAFQGSAPQVFTDVDELVQAKVAQAADVCVPHCFHHTIALTLLGGGMHTMVEKPLGITVQASKKIIEAAQRQGLVLATGENIRRYLTARSCTWAVRDKRIIGNVLLATVQSINRQPFDYGHPALKWRGLKLLTGGGMIMDSGAHFGDMVQVLFGEPDQVYCVLHACDDRLIEGAPVVGSAPADVEDTWHAVIRFKSGVTISWTYSRFLYGDPLTFATYYGNQGTMKDLGFAFHPFQGGGQGVLADGTQVSSEQIQADYMAHLTADEKERLFPYESTDGFAIEAWDFANAIATGRRPEMDGNDGLRAKTLCESCYESATAGKLVRFVDVLQGRVDAYQKPINDFWRI